MESLEYRIGYEFKDPRLLEEALTHPSLAYETNRPHFDNQRLEYLGDAVLQLALTNKLFHLFPTFSEGRLTKLRSRLVSRDALCHYSIAINLGRDLMLGKGESASGGGSRPSNLADGFEALIGAIYLDGGMDAATVFVLDHCADAIDHIADEPQEVNPKGQLQEILQAISSTSPSYRVVSEEGPDHLKMFTSRVEWGGLTLGTGSGSSKKEAEIKAAAKALETRQWASLETGDKPGDKPETP